MRTTHLPNLLACLLDRSFSFLFFFISSIFFVVFAFTFVLSVLYYFVVVPTCPPTYQPTYLFTYLPIHLSTYTYLLSFVYVYSAQHISVYPLARIWEEAVGGGSEARGRGGGGRHSLPGGPITKTTLNATCDLPPPGLFAIFHVHLLPPLPPSLTPHSSSHAPCPLPCLAPARSKYISQGGGGGGG